MCSRQAAKFNPLPFLQKQNQTMIFYPTSMPRLLGKVSPHCGGVREDPLRYVIFLVATIREEGS